MHTAPERVLFSQVCIIGGGAFDGAQPAARTERGLAKGLAHVHARAAAGADAARRRCEEGTVRGATRHDTTKRVWMRCSVWCGCRWERRGALQVCALCVL
jgi:hypothetical protein